MHLVESGGEIVAMALQHGQGATSSTLRSTESKHGMSIIYADLGSTQKLLQALSSNTRLVCFECPVSPTMQVIDIRTAVLLVKAFKRDIITAMDNSLTTPCFLRPLDLGDLLMQKVMSGYRQPQMVNCLISDRIDASLDDFLRN